MLTVTELNSKGNWKGVHRAVPSPWVRRSALTMIGAAALMVFPLTMNTVDKSQFVAPVAIGTVPEVQRRAPYIEPRKPIRNDPPPRIVDPESPRLAPAKPAAVSITLFVPIKKPSSSTEDSSVPVPDPVVPPTVPPPLPSPPPFEEQPPPLPPPVDLPPEPIPTPTIPPPGDDHHHRCHCKKCKEPDPEETNGGEHDQQETPEEDDQHEIAGETPTVVDSGTGTEESTAVGQ